MKKFHIGILWSLIGFQSLFLIPVSSPKGCGDDGIICGEGKQCCEHTVATFCENETCAYEYVKGQCVESGQSCEQFWCGNRQCGGSWLRTEDVCCVYQETAGISYKCSGSELSCKGNTTQISIRSSDAKQRATVASSALE
jgi:hypothetical protein